jgi:hypothetical protein
VKRISGSLRGEGIRIHRSLQSTRDRRGYSPVNGILVRSPHYGQ